MSSPTPEEVLQEATNANDKYILAEILNQFWDETDAPLDGEGGVRTGIDKPEIIVEGEETRRSVSYANQDVIFVIDDGNPEIQPNIGLRTQLTSVPLGIELHTSEQDRFYSGRTETYGGIIGETSRIIDAVRAGFGPYDRIDKKTISDQTASYGANNYVATWRVDLIEYAVGIPQSQVELRESYDR